MGKGMGSDGVEWNQKEWDGNRDWNGDKNRDGTGIQVGSEIGLGWQ